VIIIFVNADDGGKDRKREKSNNLNNKNRTSNKINKL